MNMGWEVPGLSDVAMQVRSFGLQAYGLDFARPYEFNVDGESDGWQAVNMVDINSGALAGTWVLTPGDDPILNATAPRSIRSGAATKSACGSSSDRHATGSSTTTGIVRSVAFW